MEPLRVAVVSEDPLTRGGVAALLGGRPDVAVAVATTPGGAGAAVASARAETVLWDASNDADALGDVAAAVPVVALVSTEAGASRALAAGARGVLFRDAEGDRVAAALAAAARGLLVVDAALSAWVRARAGPPQGEAEGLTRREGEVLALLAEGLSNKAIAARLGIAERTAKFHVESILGKLGAESRSEAIVVAARRGLVTL